MTDMTGQTIGNYQVIEKLGEGGMGTVWAGRHITLNQLVAIKFVHPKLAGSAEALRRFDTEAKAAARIKSRYVAQVLQLGPASSVIEAVKTSPAGLVQMPRHSPSTLPV